jgi:hypothetical protein
MRQRVQDVVNVALEDMAVQVSNILLGLEITGRKHNLELILHLTAIHSQHIVRAIVAVVIVGKDKSK